MKVLMFGWEFPPKIYTSQFFWHIWGADLYELSSGLRYKLFYYAGQNAVRFRLVV